MLVGSQAACLRHSEVFVRMMRGASGVTGLDCHSIRNGARALRRRDLSLHAGCKRAMPIARPLKITAPIGEAAAAPRPRRRCAVPSTPSLHIGPLDDRRRLTGLREIWLRMCLEWTTKSYR